MRTATWMALTAAAASLLSAAPAWATWRKAESANFILYSQASEAQVREQAALLEDYHDFLRMLTSVSDPPAPNKLKVYLVRDRGQLRLVRNVGQGVAGFYTATPMGIAAFADDGGGIWGGDEEILFHEIAHHFMMQYRPGAYPAWFIEGFADYVMTAEFKPNSIEFGTPSLNRVQWLTRARWLPFEKVLFEPVPRTPQEAALYYAQSWLLAHYLMRDDARRVKFRAYLQAVGTGTSPRLAFTQQFGDLRAFTQAIETYAARHLTFTKITRAGAAGGSPIKIETLPAAADSLLLSDAALNVGTRGDQVAAVLARVRSEAAKRPDDAFAKRVLAKAEILHGDPHKGSKLIDELLVASPSDAELLYLKGVRHLRVGRAEEAARAEEYKQARSWLVRAHKADQYHFPTLAAYAESLSTDPRFDSENTLNIVLLAHELAPQVEELRMNAAQHLLMRGRFDEAEMVLRPLAAHPHNARLAAAAQALVAQARAKQRLAPSQGAKSSGE